MTATGSVSALVTVGADEPLVYSLSTDTTDVTTVTSNTDAVTYTVSGDTLTASAQASGEAPVRVRHRQP